LKNLSDGVVSLGVKIRPFPLTLHVGLATLPVKLYVAGCSHAHKISNRL